MYIYMYICIHIYIYVYIYINVNIFMYMSTYILSLSNCFVQFRIYQHVNVTILYFFQGPTLVLIS